MYVRTFIHANLYLLRLCVVYAQILNTQQVKSHSSDLLKMCCISCNWIYLRLYIERENTIF